MLSRLTKTVSDEAYPINPMTSAVRKLRIRATPANVADLSKSYLIIKNSVSTTLPNGTQVVRNVSWGSSVSQESQWAYPATCQIRTASLSVAGQVVEYSEDLHVRKVNLDVYRKSVEKLHTAANYGYMGFQKLEGKKTDASDALVPVRECNNYMSNFLGDNLTQTAGAQSKGAPSYNTVSSVIFLGDIFEFCQAAQNVKLGGKEVLIELQFEDRNSMLTEFVAYDTDLSNPAVPAPYEFGTIQIQTAAGSVTIAGAPFDPAAYALANVVTIKTTNTFDNLKEFPFYVGQPVCLWKAANAPAVVGSNYFLISSIVLNADGTISLGIQAYYNGTALAPEYIRSSTTNATVTVAEVAANIATAVNTNVAIALSAVHDPILETGVNTLYTNIDAGAYSQYSVQGLELVLCEFPDPKVSGSNQVQFIQYVRDVDVIPTGQLTYQKSFQLDPGCLGVFCILPSARTAGGAMDNMLSVNYVEGVSEGLKWRNMIDGEMLYTRDIEFGSETDAVDPLYVHRLGLTAAQLGMRLDNLVQAQPWMKHDGISCHAMCAEPVPPAGVPQQLQVRITFETNTASRTIYVYKAVPQQVSL